MSPTFCNRPATPPPTLVRHPSRATLHPSPTFGTMSPGARASVRVPCLTCVHALTPSQLVGKWHLGGVSPNVNATPVPHEYGFDRTGTYGSPIQALPWLATEIDALAGNITDRWWSADVGDYIRDAGIAFMTNATRHGVPFYVHFWWHMSRACWRPAAGGSASVGLPHDGSLAERSRQPSRTAGQQCPAHDRARGLVVVALPPSPPFPVHFLG